MDLSHNNVQITDVFTSNTGQIYTDSIIPDNVPCSEQIYEYFDIFHTEQFIDNKWFPGD